MCRPGILCFLSLAAFCGTPEFDRARDLYQHTQYRESLATLARIDAKDATHLKLMGQNYFMLGEHQRALDAFSHALAVAPTPEVRSSVHHWIGRTHGRQAETGSMFTAPGHASKARANFEEAVRLDPSNKEAANDLFDYYLQAPGFLGGGLDKAEALAQRIARLDAAEGHFAQAQLCDKRRQYDQAEQHLRQAADMEPGDAGRWIDLAKFVARRGRLQESDTLFDHAGQIDPWKPQLLFARAEVYVRNRYHLEEARKLLDRYLNAPLTPDDPPASRARALIEKLK